MQWIWFMNVPKVARTALKIFREKALMFPTPMRIYLWEDFIYTYRGQMLKKGAKVIE